MIIPPRLNAHADDYDPAIGAALDVFVNGVLRTTVISYDIPAGTVERYVTDSDGRFVVDGDDAKRETLTGHVEVKPRAAATNDDGSSDRPQS